MCEPPPQGVNTETVSDTPVKVNSSYHYQCLAGFVPFHPFQNNTETKCLPDLKWSMDQPVICTSMSNSIYL